MNIPRNNPNGKKTSARNTQVSSMILAIFEALKNKPENKGKDEFQILKDFLDYYRIESDFGLLEEISKNGTVTFDMIKNDGFDIEKIIGDDRHTSASTLHNVLNSSNMGELGKDIEKIVIKKLVEKIKDKIPNELKSNFDREINNARTLNEFKNQLWNFIDYGDGGKAVNEEVYKEIKAIRIENKDIVDGLIKDGKIGTNDLDGNFKDWNASVSKKIDKLVTQEYLDGMKSGLEFLDKNFGLLKNTFNDFVPNMSWITKKYTYDESNVDEDILEQKNQAEEKGDSKEFNKLSFLAYIQSIGKSNKRLAEILKKLLENDFDFGKLDKEEQNDFLRDSVDARLEELKANNVSNIISVDQSDFENFAKKLFDLNQNEIVIDTAQGDIRLGVNKKIKSGKNINWMDMSDINEAKIPLEFDIKVLDQDNDLLKNAAIRKVFGNEISEDGKSINLNTDNIGKLFLLYVLAQNSFDNILMNEENVEKLKDIFDDNKEGKEETKKDEDKKDGESENKGGTDIEKSSDSGTSIESKEKTSDQKFLESRDNIRGYQFPESKGETFDGKEIGKGFEVGTRLWIKTGFDTELPPKDVGGDQWIQLKIIDINNDSFVVQLEGGELSAGSLEGKKITYPKTKESLEKITNAFNGEVYKLTEPKDFRESVSNINSSSLSNLNGIGVFDEVEKKGGKLISNILEGNPEITHFGGIETKTGENDKVAETKDIINYEVKLNNNGTVDVSYGNYKRKMDYSNFIIFVSTKRLKPKTKEDVEIENKEIERTDVHRGSKLKFFSIKNIWNMVKGMGKKLDEGFKKYNEKQDKEFYNIAMGKRRIANKLQGLIGWVPGIGDALENMDTEYQNNLDKETWEKTEAILKKIEGHNDYGRAFGEKSYLNEILGAGVSLKDMVESGKLPGGLNSDKRFVASAVLLAQISKGPGPYHKLGEHRFKGIRVKLLLGEPYYSKFMKDQNEIIAEMKAKQGLYGPGYDAQLAAELARAEMTFLINNIGGRAPGQRLGNIGKGPTEDYAKKLRSDKFAGELETRFNDYMSRSKVEEGAGKLENVHNFTFAYGEYRRFLESGRPTKAIPFIKKMAQLAKSPDQIKTFKGALLYGMLTGFFLHYALPSTQVWLQGICRSFGFSPGLWIPHIDSQKKTAHFLDVASGSDFFKSTKYKISDFDFGKEINYKKFREGENGFENRWGRNSGRIDNFLTKDMYRKDMKDPIINQLKEASIEAQQEDIDQDVSKNSKLISNYPLSLTKGVISQISRYRDGHFEGKDVDEIQRSQDAWNAITGAVPKGSNVEKGRLIYATKKFLNWFDDSFDSSGKEELIRIFSTIKKYKNELNMNGGKIEKYFEGRKVGKIDYYDIKNVMWYMTSGKIFQKGNYGSPPNEYREAIDAFENMLRNNIDNIDEDFIAAIFGKENVKYFGKENSYELMPWDIYTTITEIGTSQLNDWQKRLKTKYMELNNKGVVLNKKMKNIYENINRRMSCPPIGGEIKEEEKDLFD